MTELSELSKTLYVPLAGRIYASKHYPAMITDLKVLALESALPAEAERMRHGQSEYTMLASVARSINMDRRIRAFLADYPDAAVVNVGCGSMRRSPSGRSGAAGGRPVRVVSVTH